MMRTSTRSGRIIAALTAVVFLMTSFLTVFADVTVSETSTTTVQAGGTATINVANAVGSEQTTVLVYLGTPDDGNIIYIDQAAAKEGTATFTFKVPTTAKEGTYTVLAGSESTTTAGDATLVVTAAGTTPDPTPTLVSIAVAADAKVAYTVGDEFVAPVVTATYSDASTATVTAQFTGYDMTTAGEQTVTVTYEGVSTTYVITVSEPVVVPPTLVSIAVSGAQTAYTVGDEFVAPTVVATYSDDSTATVEATFTGYDMSIAGEQTVTVTYEGVSTTYVITVSEPVVVPPTLVSIAVAADAKVAYTVGDEFVAPTVTATYSDDSTAAVTAEFTGYDMSTAGTQTVTVSYGGQTITYEITVAEGDLEPWAVVATRDADDTVNFASNAFDGRWQGETSSDKISNANGSGLGLDGTNSTAFTYSRAGGWSGVQTASLPATVDLAKTTNFSFYARIIPTTEGVTSSSFNVNFAGDAKCKFEATTGWQFFTFDLSEYDLTATTQLQFLVNTKNAGSLIMDNLTFSNYGVTPISPLLQSIEIVEPVTEYEFGGSFVAPVVKATYNDGTVVDVTDATFEGYDMASNGTQTVTAKYKGFTATYEILVGEAEGPTANYNVRNGSKSAAATVATSSYDFHLKYNVALEPNTDYIMSAWSKGSGSVILAGRLNGSWGGGDAKNLTLASGDNWAHSATVFNSGAEANGRAIDSVTLCFITNGFGSKGTMYVDDVFLAKASDPTVNLIPDPGFELGEWGTDKAVLEEVSEIAVSAENITLAAINAKTAYTTGDEFVAPEKVVIVKNDGSTAEVTGATIEGYDMATAGTQTVTVKYDNLSTKYLITVSDPVSAPTLVSIAVAADAKVAYTVGDEFVAPVVTATYSDDSTAVVTAEFAGYDMATAGEQTVTVTYEGVTTTYVITVSEPVVVPPTLESIAVAADAKVAYTVGDEFVAPEVTATYSDGSTAVVTATFSGYDMNAEGPQTVTVTYEGVTTTYVITVTAAAPTYNAVVETSKDLGYADDEEPAEVYFVKSFTLSEGNGEYEVKIGDRQLYWSDERQCYVGVVDAANYDATAKTFINVSIEVVEKATALKYGDLDGNGRINNTDLGSIKNYLELGQIPVIRPASDVNVDGRINNTDLQGISTYIETEEPFFPEN